VLLYITCICLVTVLKKLHTAGMRVRSSWLDLTGSTATGLTNSARGLHVACRIQLSSETGCSDIRGHRVISRPHRTVKSRSRSQLRPKLTMDPRPTDVFRNACSLRDGLKMTTDSLDSGDIITAAKACEWRNNSESTFVPQTE
jgi:hypothetical protein